jgi:hypothetical protein
VIDMNASTSPRAHAGDDRPLHGPPSWARLAGGEIRPTGEPAMPSPRKRPASPNAPPAPNAEILTALGRIEALLTRIADRLDHVTVEQTRSPVEQTRSPIGDQVSTEHLAAAAAAAAAKAVANAAARSVAPASQPAWPPARPATARRAK